MSDVFISYSRKDIEFAQRIHHELEARDREPWVDWQDIPPTSEWLDEVYAGIQEADTFLFIISPDSVVSEICTLEIEHAIQHNKRLVPVVLHDVEDDQVHSAMLVHNWVFLREEDDFDANLELLITALDTDLDYVREHTRLLTLFAFYQRNEVEKAQERAEKTARVSKSHALAAFALIEQEKDPELSLLLATEAVRTTYDASETVLPLSNTVLRQSIIKSRVRLALTGHDGEAHSAFYSADGARIVTASSDMTAKVWDAKTGTELMTLKGHDNQVNLVDHGNRVWIAVYSADGARIVTTGDMIAKVWDAKTGKELLTLKGHEGWVTTAFYSPDGARIVTAGDMIAKVWDAKTGTELMTLTGHGDYVWGATYSPDGARIVTAGDIIAKVWDANTGTELMTLIGHDSGVWSVTYSPDGKRIATAGEDGIVQIYTTDMEELLQIAESRVTRQLTAEEKEKYGVLDLN